jgi:hypothetical protein
MNPISLAGRSRSGAGRLMERAPIIPPHIPKQWIELKKPTVKARAKDRYRFKMTIPKMICAQYTRFGGRLF